MNDVDEAEGTLFGAFWRVNSERNISLIIWDVAFNTVNNSA